MVTEFTLAPKFHMRKNMIWRIIFQIALYLPTYFILICLFQVLSLVLLVSQTLAIPSLLGNNNHNHDHDHNHHHHHHEESNDASEDYYDENSDRSYKFDFEAEGYSREEEAESDGIQRGIRILNI